MAGAALALLHPLLTSLLAPALASHALSPFPSLPLLPSALRRSLSPDSLSLSQLSQPSLALPTGWEGGRQPASTPSARALQLTAPPSPIRLLRPVALRLPSSPLAPFSPLSSPASPSPPLRAGRPQLLAGAEQPGWAKRRTSLAWDTADKPHRVRSTIVRKLPPSPPPSVSGALSEQAVR
eukprot:scaffold159130_cov32-Tisochrysis_lutea.AAC.1